MTISSLDPGGELGRLFSSIQPKSVSSNAEQHPDKVVSGQRQDQVDLSVFAREVREITYQANQHPEIRVDRVAAIREALNDRAVLASSEQIADALFRETILNELSLS